MKAVIYEHYGPPEVLRLTDVPKPTPKANEVLVKVRATTVTAGDANVRGFVFIPAGFGFFARLMFGLRKPRKPILGMEFSGKIEAVGSAVTQFKPGDAVFGSSGMHMSTYAEYVCLPEDAMIIPKPANVSYEEAAAMSFGGQTALYFLRDKANVQPGQSVLVFGASGSTGSAAVQIARYYEAQVTGVCSTRNAEMVKSLGANHVIDYTQEDFTQRGETYDVIYDTVHGKLSFGACKHALKSSGLYLAVAGGIGTFAQMAWTALRGGKKVIAGTPPADHEPLLFLKQLAEEGAFTPFIDRTYPLEEIVAAHRHVDTQHKRGNVAITIAHHNHI
jgi:NADPH:quinone reductase-like Zn-dependent oxidoreductase